MKTKKQQYDLMFMKIAVLASKQSHCRSFKVAAVAVKKGHILYTGINGTPPGFINCDDNILLCPDHFATHEEWREAHHNFSLKYEIHSEQSLLGGASKEGISLDGAIVYQTLSPCQDCLKLMIISGIKEIVYLYDYDKTDPESLTFAKECDVKIRKLVVEDYSVFENL
jgi:dCMP deaminase